MANFINTWEKNRKKGRIKYALTHGVIFGTLVPLIKNRGVVWDLIKENEADWSILLIDFLWFFIGATLGYYFLMWWWNERKYKKEKRKLS